nr:MAG TPA: hypothetical protein [Caudoviricetes sp.]
MTTREMAAVLFLPKMSNIKPYETKSNSYFACIRGEKIHVQCVVRKGESTVLMCS